MIRKKFNIRIFSINDIPKEAKYVTFKTQEWQEIFPSITKKRIDVIKEDHYIIVVKFKDGAIIPFEFLPKQKAFFDLRKNHFNVVFFGANTFEKIDTLFKKTIECLMRVSNTFIIRPTSYNRFISSVTFASQSSPIPRLNKRRTTTINYFYAEPRMVLLLL